jgi:hypothetical protein
MTFLVTIKLPVTLPVTNRLPVVVLPVTNRLPVVVFPVTNRLLVVVLEVTMILLVVVFPLPVKSIESNKILLKAITFFQYNI